MNKREEIKEIIYNIIKFNDFFRDEESFEKISYDYADKILEIMKKK